MKSSFIVMKWVQFDKKRIELIEIRKTLFTTLLMMTVILLKNVTKLWKQTTKNSKLLPKSLCVDSIAQARKKIP
jgi:hypothetical protein